MAYFPKANMLVPIGSVAYKSNTPTSKYVIVTVTPVAVAIGTRVATTTPQVAVPS